MDLGPRMISNLTITTNSTIAMVSWETKEGPLLKVDLMYVEFFLKFLI